MATTGKKAVKVRAVKPSKPKTTAKSPMSKGMDPAKEMTRNKATLPVTKARKQAREKVVRGANQKAS